MKEKGNDAFKKKKYEVAEKFYSDALELNLDSRPVWTNRAICRNTMAKHADSLADCLSALSIDPKNTKKGILIGEIMHPLANSGYRSTVIYIGINLKTRSRQSFKKEMHIWDWVSLMRPNSAMSPYVNSEKHQLLKIT